MTISSFINIGPVPSPHMRERPILEAHQNPGDLRLVLGLPKVKGEALGRALRLFRDGPGVDQES